MTRPCRRITLHLSQIGVTLGFTFTAVSILFYLLVGLWFGLFTCSGTRCGHGTGRRETTPPPPGPRAGCVCSPAASCRLCGQAPYGRSPAQCGTSHWAGARPRGPRPLWRRPSWPSFPEILVFGFVAAYAPGSAQHWLA